MSKIYYYDLFDEIVSEENIYSAYKQLLKNRGKYKAEAMAFQIDEAYNLEQIRLSLINESYEFDGYIRIVVFEPKERVIDAPHFKDKIVQLAINNVLKKVYNRSFIHDSYACIDDKGTHKCAKRIQYLMQKAKWEYGEKAVIIKGDFKKYFYTINRGILKKLLLKKIKCKRTLRLLFKVIDSADVIDLIGMPLGNTISQICANIYLNELDNFCKRKLRLKYFVRYMDDFVSIVENQDVARNILRQINSFAHNLLELKLNKNKTKTSPISKGVNAIGYKIYTTHMLLRNDSKKKIKRKIRAMPHLILEDKLTIKKAEQMLNSWKGHAEHGDSHNFIQSLLNRFDFIYLVKKKNGKTVFRIDDTKLQKEVA